MSNLESTAERELLDMTERVPPRFDERELSAASGSAKLAAMPPPIPTRARARATTELPLPPPPASELARGWSADASPDSVLPPMREKATASLRAVPPPIPTRAATVPPPIPTASSRRATLPPPARKSTLPPPIPGRAQKPSASPFVASTPPPEQESVDVEMTPPPAAAPPASVELAPELRADARAELPEPRRKSSAWDDFASTLPSLPDAKPRGRGTIPPLPTPNSHAFVVAPDATNGSQMFAAQPLPVVVPKPPVVAQALAHDDPTPLPRPMAYADLTSDIGGLKFDLRRHSSRGPKMVAGGLVVVGIIAIAFLATRAGLGGDKASSHSSASLNGATATQPELPAPAEAQPAAPAPATQANAAAATDPAQQPTAAVAADPAAQTASPTPQPGGVKVRSQPTGATVTLLDNGKNWELGKTPFAVTLDHTRNYEIIVAMPGYDTKVVQIEAQTNEVSVALTPTGGTAAAAAPVTAEAAKPDEAAKPAATEEPAAKAEREVAASEPIAKPERKRSRSRSKSTTVTPKADEAPRARVAAAAPSNGDGTLMVSSKPPCEIAIDGKSSSLTTPQRAIKLSAGKHKITLTNPKFKVAKTFEINIDPKKPTKLIKDFMSAN